MEVRGPEALTTGQRNVHEIDRSVTKRRIGQSQSSGALQQAEVGQAEKIDGGTKRIGVVDDSGDQRERRGVPLRRHGVGGPQLHVTARTHLGKQRAQVVAPFLERRRRPLEPLPERPVHAIHRRHQHRRSVQGELEVFVERGLRVVGQAGSHRIELSPGARPGAPPTGAPSFVQRRIGEDRHDVGRGGVQHAPAHPRLVAEIDAHLQ